MLSLALLPRRSCRVVSGCLSSGTISCPAKFAHAFRVPAQLPSGLHPLPARLPAIKGGQTRLYSSRKKKKKHERGFVRKSNEQKEAEKKDVHLINFYEEFEKALVGDEKPEEAKKPGPSPGKKSKKKGKKAAEESADEWADEIEQEFSEEATEAEELFTTAVAKPFVPATDEAVVVPRKYTPPKFAKLTRFAPKIARVEDWVPAVQEFAYRRKLEEEQLDRERQEWVYWLKFKKRRMRTSDPKERAYIKRMQKTRPPPPKQADRRPPIRRPSAASGGVPEPTLAYLAQAMDPVQDALEEPQPLLVVLDLNGTLLHRPQRRNKPAFFATRRHAVRFLKYCLDTFWVVIWSSARPENVDRILRQLIPSEEQRNRIVAVWAREHFGLCPEDYDKRVQCYKRLSWLWADPTVAQTHPDYEKGGRWSQANTVLVDDSIEKARTEPHNIIAIPEYLGTPGDQTDVSKDRVLPEVHDYLNELCFQPDVSAYMREKPFRAVSGLGP